MSERLLRYRKKISILIEKLVGIPKKIDSDIAKDAALFRIHIAIEAAMDIAAMLVKDHGRDVSDDYHNIEMLVDIKTLDSSLAEQLKKLNGLRNAIIHKYNKFEEKTVFENKEKIVSTLKKFLSVIDHELKTLFGKAAE
ncbi:MAG: DUF86 domain-containing protein [Candidatus Aenigmarchaeota archaeon]|nr:DUF86 domain-containing protein [Candidatus Aenigmarchaeota archaeon]